MHFVFIKKRDIHPNRGNDSPWPVAHFSTPVGLIILAFLINHGLTGVLFVDSFACLSVLFVSSPRHRSGAN